MDKKSNQSIKTTLNNWSFVIREPIYYICIMKRLLLVAALFTGMFANAQYNIDFGVKLGGANYLGEMGGKEQSRRNFVMDMKLSQTRWALGAFGRYRINPYVAVNLGFTYGRIQGADSLSSNPGRVGRNLSFRNDILDLSLRGELYLYKVNDVGNRGRYRTDFQTFVFAGVSGFYSNPKAKNTNYSFDWVALQPLQTEGVEYSKLNLSIPLGIGFFFTYQKQHRFGWELGWHTTFTDYIDDASTQYADPATLDPIAADYFANRTDELNPDDFQDGFFNNFTPGDKRGDPNHNDTFLFMNFTYSYVIKGPNSFYRSHYSWIGGRSRGFRKVRAKF